MKEDIEMFMGVIFGTLLNPVYAFKYTVSWYYSWKLCIYWLQERVMKKSFKKYATIGAFIWFTGMIISTTLLFLGREVLLIDLRILSPITYAITFAYGFLTKYILYNKWGMLKE